MAAKEKIQVNTSQEKEERFYKEISNLRYKINPDDPSEEPYMYDHFTYDYLFELTTDFIREIKRNSIIYVAIGQNELYLNQIKADLDELLKDYRFPTGEFYQDVMLCKGRILEEIQQIDAEPEEQEKKTKRIRMKVIALKYALEGKAITRKNGPDIAKLYGHSSGDALYNDYCKYANRIDRLGHPGSQGELKGKINVYRETLKILKGEAKERAQSELNILAARYGNSE